MEFGASMTEFNPVSLDNKRLFGKVYNLTNHR
jgi:hypothetical protein